MKVLDILVTSVTIISHNRAILRNTRNLFMKVSNISVTSVSMRLHERTILKYTRNLFMKVKNISVISVTIRQDGGRNSTYTNLENIIIDLLTYYKTKCHRIYVS